MNGKQLLLDALRGGTTPRPAWVPFVGVHGGRLAGVSATDYLTDSRHILAGLRKAYDLYQPDGLPVVFDLQLEAEVLGCRLNWAQKDPPAVVSHPLAGAARLENLPAFSTSAGRFPVVADAVRKLKSELGDRVALYGLVTGPFTLNLHLTGSDIFLRMFEDPDGVNRVGAFCAQVACQVADLYMDCGVDVIALVDPMTSQISPAHFQQFVTTHANTVFDHVHARGGLCSIFVCGDATRNLENMCRTRCDNVSVDENISLASLVEQGRRHGKSIGGNIRLTSVLLMGDPDDARRDAIRCIDACGTQGYVLSPGCDLPYDVPPANLQAVAQMVHDTYARDVARNTLAAKVGDAFDDIVLPDYAAQPEVIVDVITLDSGGCAPCQYMLEAVNQAVRAGWSDLRGRVAVREHMIKTRHGLGYMQKLGVDHIPSICIDGELKFSSLIPDPATLLAALREKLAAKTR